MPIKFRCQHCRQFLGISRSRAGAVVDCPTCGRALRVPHLDGTIEPLPEPGMDLRDSQLSQALDELAQIAEREAGLATQDEREARRGSAAVVTQEEAPLELGPAPAPVPVDPPLPARPTSGAALMKVKPLPPRRGAPQSEASEPHGEAGRPPVRPARSTVLSDEFIGLVHLPDERASVEPTPHVVPTITAGERLRARRGWAAKRPSRAVLITCGVAAVALAAGFLAGRAGRGPAPPAGQDATAPGTGGSAGATLDDAPASFRGLSGRITFAGEGGLLEPDAGARILALPADASTGEKLPAQVLLDDERRSEADAALASAGGGFATAGDDGRFTLTLPRAGAYLVLVVSAHQSREGGAPPRIEEFLSTRVDRPALISGRRACVLREIRYPGSGAVPFDCVFERPP